MNNLALTLITIACCGLGTFLLRYLPLRQRMTGGRRHPLWNGFLQAVGPAAITALVVVSLWGMTGKEWADAKNVAILVGVAGTLATHWLGRKNLVLTVLGGTLAYGAAVAALHVTV